MSGSLVSFDGTERVDGELRRPDRFAALRADLEKPGWAPRGAGLSYCAAGLGPRTIDATKFDRVLSFDAERGVVEVEAGATLGGLYELLWPRGWELPVMPGHPSITVGGCVGANVHGKNQHLEGTFSACVERLTLFHPDRGEVSCSKAERPELFELTLGGYGLTGFILRVTLRARRPPAAAYRMHRLSVRDYEDALRVMESRTGAASLYSWHLPGGRGFVYAAEPDPSAPKAEGALPSWERLDAGRRARGPQLLNALTALPALQAFHLKESLLPKEKTVTAWQASFPVCGREFYFKLFGAKGFREYQLLVPRDAFAPFCRELGALRRKHPAPITLATMKLFAGKRRFLNFTGDGVVLVLNAADGAHARALWDALDPVVAAHGGLVNVVKDSRLTAAAARRFFPEYDAFKQALSAWDPRRVVDTALRRRLEL